MKFEDSFLWTLWEERLFPHLRSLTARKPESISSHSGAQQSSESTMQLIEPARLAEAEVTRYIAATASPFANPLGANDASDWELYQGCKVPTMNDNLVWSVKRNTWVTRAEAEKEYAEERQNDKVSTYKALYGGLPTDDKARKRLKLWTFLIDYFPDTFLALVEVAVTGNEQHNPGQPLHWAREKSTDQMNTAFRHQFDYGRGVKKDTDGQWHLAKAIWRLSAQLQLDIEEERRQNGNK